MAHTHFNPVNDSIALQLVCKERLDARACALGHLDARAHHLKARLFRRRALDLGHMHAGAKVVAVKFEKEQNGVLELRGILVLGEPLKRAVDNACCTQRKGAEQDPDETWGGAQSAGGPSILGLVPSLKWVRKWAKKSCSGKTRALSSWLKSSVLNTVRGRMSSATISATKRIRWAEAATLLSSSVCFGTVRTP